MSLLCMRGRSQSILDVHACVRPAGCQDLADAVLYMVSNGLLHGPERLPRAGKRQHRRKTAQPTKCARRRLAAEQAAVIRAVLFHIRRFWYRPTAPGWALDSYPRPPGMEDRPATVQGQASSSAREAADLSDDEARILDRGDQPKRRGRN